MKIIGLSVPIVNYSMDTPERSITFLESGVRRDEGATLRLRQRT